MRKKSKAWKRFDKQYAESQRKTAHLKTELKHHRYYKMLDKLLDCRTIDKFDGEIGYVPKPVTTRANSYLDVQTTVSLLKSGAVIHHDVMKKERTVILNNRIIGHIYNSVLNSVLKLVLCRMSAISGTNIIEYRAV